jgi:hypothetical protein
MVAGGPTKGRCGGGSKIGKGDRTGRDEELSEMRVVGDGTKEGKGGKVGEGDIPLLTSSTASPSTEQKYLPQVPFTTKPIPRVLKNTCSTEFRAKFLFFISSCFRSSSDFGSPTI